MLFVYFTKFARKFGISIVEAMAASKPVVISKYSNSKSIKKADAGIICEDNVEDYSRCKKLLSKFFAKRYENNGKKLQKIFMIKLSKQLELLISIKSMNIINLKI